MAKDRQEQEHESTPRLRGAYGASSLADAHPDTDEEAEEAVAVPFSLEELAMTGGPTQGAEKGPTGQFSGDDLEFESFMFDSGDVQALEQSGIGAPTPAPTAAPAPTPTP